MPPLSGTPAAAATPAAARRGWWLFAAGGLALGVSAALWQPLIAHGESTAAATPTAPDTGTTTTAPVPGTPSPRLQHWTVAGRAVTVVELPAGCGWQSQIVWRDQRAAFLTQPAAVLINGGYFEPDYRPSGLLIDSARQPKEAGLLSARPLLSGFIWCEPSGRIAMAAATQEPPPWAAPARWVVQSGPMLVEPGGKMGIHSAGRLSPRTVLAWLPGRLWVVSTEAVSLFDLAQALIDRGVDRAINLDGGPSTTLDVQWPASPSDSGRPATHLHRPGDPLVPYYLGWAPEPAHAAAPPAFYQTK